MLAARAAAPDLAPDPALPDDTRLWAALQHAGGGTWGGCVYDVDAIVHALSTRPLSPQGRGQGEGSEVEGSEVEGWSLTTG